MFAIANILMGFMAKNLSDPGKFCSIKELSTFDLVGRGGDQIRKNNTVV